MVPSARFLLVKFMEEYTMPFFLGEKKIAGLGINDKNYIVKETTFTDPIYLRQAYPNGNEYAYMIGQNGAYSIFVWNEEILDWQEVGNFGPYGDSMTGPRGFRGFGVKYHTVVTKDPNGFDEVTVYLTQEPNTNAEAIVTIKEAVRQATEEIRKANEEARINAETIRQSAEAARIEAENARLLAEQARQLAEADRIQAEKERKSAEADRLQAEQERAEAEIYRQQTIDGQLGLFLQNRLPIKQTNSTTTTEVYYKYNVINCNGNLYECICDEAPAGSSLTDETKFLFLFGVGSTQVDSGGGYLLISEKTYKENYEAGSLDSNTAYIVWHDTGDLNDYTII